MTFINRNLMLMALIASIISVSVAGPMVTENDHSYIKPEILDSSHIFDYNAGSIDISAHSSNVNSLNMGLEEFLGHLSKDGVYKCHFSKDGLYKGDIASAHKLAMSHKNPSIDEANYNEATKLYMDYLRTVDSHENANSPFTWFLLQ